MGSLTPLAQKPSPLSHQQLPYQTCTNSQLDISTGSLLGKKCFTPFEQTL